MCCANEMQVVDSILYGMANLLIQKFYLVANVCKATTVKELVSLITTRRRIPKDSVVSERKQA
jgi:hypothetical protein